MNGAWSPAQGGLLGTSSPCLLLGADGSYSLAKVWVPLWRAIGDYLAQCTVGSERNEVLEWGGFFWKVGKHNLYFYRPL